MKKVLLSLFCLLALAGTVSAETYKHTFSEGELSANGGTAILSDIEWSYTSATSIGWDENNGKGIQIGSSKSPNASYSLSSSAFAGCTIKSVTVESSTANGGDAKLTIAVGNQQSETFSLGTSNAPYTFDCEDTEGDISISWAATTKAYYLCSITVEYIPAAGTVNIPAPVFTTAVGIYADKVSVIAETEDHDAAIYYTIDGTTPSYEDYSNSTGSTKSSRTWQLYETLTTTTTIKAMAVRTDEDGNAYKSEITEATYIVSPTKPYVPATAITSGNAYALLANDSIATPITDGSNGYLGGKKVTKQEKYIESTAYNGFTFTATNGGYTIQDAEGRYMYTKEQDNNFYFDSNKPAQGAVWSVSVGSDGTATISNGNGKTICYSIEDDHYACCNDEQITGNNVLPKLYMLREYPTVTISPATNSTLQVLETITVTCEEGIKAKSLKVTADGISGVKFTVKQKDTNTLEIKANKQITTTDNVTIKINITGDIMLNPNGMNMALPITKRYGVRTLATYTLTGDAPAGEIIEVSPANNATVEKLSYILFTFNSIPNKTEDTAIAPRLYAQGSSELIPVEYTTHKEGSTSAFVEFEQAALVVTEPVTAKGTYILEIPDGYFVDKNGKEIKGITLKYTVENDGTGIDEITTDATNAAYDLMGRKVENPTRGIYIVNGKKTFIK